MSEEDNQESEGKPDLLGSHVRFYDAEGREHDALVIHCHGNGLVNLIYVPDSWGAGSDHYGKIPENATSVHHASQINPGQGLVYCWS